jgi:hypothetical protein
MTDISPAVTLNTAKQYSVSLLEMLQKMCSWNRVQLSQILLIYVGALNRACLKYSKRYKWELHFLQYLRRHLPPTAEKHLQFFPL